MDGSASTLMPKRTNEFQELVALIERALAPRGAKILESALLADSDADEREIDVLIESSIGPYRMKIAVEAKDEKRPMDIVKFESIVGKYSSRSGINVNQVVVISRAGFSRKVQKRAVAEKIELMTLREALDIDWSTKTPQRMLLAVGPLIQQFEFDPPIPNVDPTVLAREAILFCKSCGKSHYGTPLDLAHKMFVDEDTLYDLRVWASRTGRMACTRPQWTFKHTVLRHRSTDYPINSLRCHFHCKMGRTALEVKSYEHGEQIVNHFSGNAAGQNIQFAMSSGPHPEQIAVRLSTTTVLDDQNSEAPTNHANIVDVSPLPEDVLSRVKEALDGLDAAFDSTPLHDFESGEEVAVPLLVRIYYQSGRRLRTAIIMNRGPTAVTADEVRKWEGRCRTIGLDRVIIVSPSGFSSEAEAAIEKSLLVKAFVFNATKEELFSLILPRPTLSACAFLSLHAEFFSPSARKFVPTNNAKLYLDNKVDLTIENFARLLRERLIQFSRKFFINRDPFTPLYADGDIHFKTGLPVSLKLVSEMGVESEISSLCGTAKIRGCFLTFKNVTCVGNKLVFSPNEQEFPSLYCNIPRSDSMELVGGNLAEPNQNLLRKLPENALDNLLCPSTDTGLSPENSGTYKVATLDIKRETDLLWQLQVLSVRMLKALPSGSEFDLLH
jgi:hypothetical protein